MGCRSLPYWVGNFVFDYIMLTIFVIIFVIAGQSSKFISKTNNPVINNVIVFWVICFMGFNLAAIPLSYIVSTWFKKTSSA